MESWHASVQRCDRGIRQRRGPVDGVLMHTKRLSLGKISAPASRREEEGEVGGVQ